MELSAFYYFCSLFDCSLHRHFHAAMEKMMMMLVERSSCWCRRRGRSYHCRSPSWFMLMELLSMLQPSACQAATLAEFPPYLSPVRASGHFPPNENRPSHFFPPNLMPHSSAWRQGEEDWLHVGDMSRSTPTHCSGVSNFHE